MSDRQTTPARDALKDWRATVDDQIKALQQRPQGAPNGLMPPGWQPLQVAAGYSAGGLPPAYALDADRFVHLRGIVEKTTSPPVVSGNVLFTLPVGLRPIQSMTFLVLGFAAGYPLAGRSWADIALDASGNMTFEIGGATFVAISLDSVPPFYAGA